MSYPLSAIGQAWLWMAVGLGKPLRSSSIVTDSGKAASRKVRTGLGELSSETKSFSKGALTAVVITTSKVHRARAHELLRCAAPRADALR
eukprot:scaffold87284_cov67-Phaeocystis_antarctica.AAC.3